MLDSSDLQILSSSKVSREGSYLLI